MMERKAIVEKCAGCKRVVENFCNACIDPSLKWKNGNCNMATNLMDAKVKANKKLNPIKASKRGIKFK